MCIYIYNTARMQDTKRIWYIHHISFCEHFQPWAAQSSICLQPFVDKPTTEEPDPHCRCANPNIQWQCQAPMGKVDCPSGGVPVGVGRRLPKKNMHLQSGMIFHSIFCMFSFTGPLFHSRNIFFTFITKSCKNDSKSREDFLFHRFFLKPNKKNQWGFADSELACRLWKSPYPSNHVAALCFPWFFQVWLNKNPHFPSDVCF